MRVQGFMGFKYTPDKCGSPLTADIHASNRLFFFHPSFYEILGSYSMLSEQWLRSNRLTITTF